MPEWPGENWVDPFHPKVREIMCARMYRAKAAGCVGIDPDNVDFYGEDNYPAFGGIDRAVEAWRWWATEAHRRGLAIGIKNGAEMLPQVADLADFAINEQMGEFSGDETPYVAYAKTRPVFCVEYKRAAYDRAHPAGVQTVLMDLNLSKILDRKTAVVPPVVTPPPTPTPGAPMANPMTPDQLLKALRNEGLTVREYAGWRDRCRCHNGSHAAGGPTVRSWGPIHGTMVHITAGGLGTRSVESYIRDIINGDPNTPTKCQFIVAPNGEVWINSAGRCNHAGTVSSASVSALANGTLSLAGSQNLRGHDVDGNTSMYGIENIAAVSMTAAQRESSVRICAAVSRAYGWDGRDAIGHGEASDQRGFGDPNLDMGRFRADVMSRIKNTTTTQEDNTMANFSADDIYQITKRAAQEAATPTPGWGGATLAQVVADTHGKVGALEVQVAKLAAGVEALLAGRDQQTVAGVPLVDVQTVAAAVAPLLVIAAKEA